MAIANSYNKVIGSEGMFSSIQHMDNKEIGGLLIARLMIKQLRKEREPIYP